MQSKRKNEKNGKVDLVPLMSVYLLWLIRHVAEIHRLSLGYLIFVDVLQRAKGFAVEVIVLPTVKINMYTDIDIFKEDINTFL